MADHLSRLQLKEKEVPVIDEMRQEQHYATHYHRKTYFSWKLDHLPKNIKRKVKTKMQKFIWDDPYLHRYYEDGE